MIAAKQAIADRIVTKLSAFNKRLEARLWRNRKILDKMHEEKDLRKSMGNLKSIFK